MAGNPVTFRDHLASIYQSAIDDMVRRKLGLAEDGLSPGADNAMLRTAAKVAELGSLRLTIPNEAPAGLAQTAWTCAKLAYQLMEARLSGNAALAGKIADELAFSECDPNWGETILEYLRYFGPDGTRADIPYIRPAAVGDVVLPLPAGATVALIADWGTGTAAAANLLQVAARQKLDALIHLGDIYYSGTEQECLLNFQAIVNRVLDRANTGIPVFTLAGNHDMYSGGTGYYGLLSTLNGTAARQPASFFCLRTADRRWQFVAMDTGLHDYNPFTIRGALTFIESEEEDWLKARIAEFPGKTILLSHHPAFSAFSQIGPAQPDGSLMPYNPHLMASFERFAATAPDRIAGWFWGHEHRFGLYRPYRGVAKGRCIGNGAVPVFAGSDSPPLIDRLIDPPALLPIEPNAADQLLVHGFAIIRIDQADGSATADYYEETDGSRPIYSERL